MVTAYLLRLCWLEAYGVLKMDTLNNAGKQPEETCQSDTKALRGYSSSTLVSFGDVRDMTLGGTVGFADSGTYMCVSSECVAPPPTFTPG